MDADGLATRPIRLEAGLKTDPLFDVLLEPGHNLEAVTDAEYLEITRSGDYDALMAPCNRVMAG
jgi:hypothetical protein